MSLFRKQEAKYEFKGTNTLWHTEDHTTLSLGCQSCTFKDDCGGLNVSAGFYDCDSLCRCVNPSACNKVCSKNAPQFIVRMKEIKGLSLDNVPRTEATISKSLPAYIPMIYHASKRERALDINVAAISLYEILDKDTGKAKFTSPQGLRSAFKLGDSTRVVLSGTHTDPSLERLWGLADRKLFFSSLAPLEIDMITAPNFSLFCDTPRVDDMHSMKRIAIACFESLEVGLPTALHVNGRTARDYARWASFIESRPEIEWLCFEFGTGAGHRNRIDYHLAQIIALARYVTRPLRILMRGGMYKVPALLPHFSEVAIIDTGAFLKTQHRQYGVFSDTKIHWDFAPTSEAEALDSLLAKNIEASENLVRYLHSVK